MNRWRWTNAIGSGLLVVLVVVCGACNQFGKDDPEYGGGGEPIETPASSVVWDVSPSGAQSGCTWSFEVTNATSGIPESTTSVEVHGISFAFRFARGTTLDDIKVELEVPATTPSWFELAPDSDGGKTTWSFTADETHPKAGSASAHSGTYPLGTWRVRITDRRKSKENCDFIRSTPILKLNGEYTE